MPRKYTDPAGRDRLWSRVQVTATCWLWTAKCDRDGYGRLRSEEQRWTRAHIYAWWLATGEWPVTGQIIGHVCDIRSCVRNDDVGTYEVDGILYERRGHLWLGTNIANLRDRDLKGRTARGAQSGACTKPEARPRGEANWSRQHPEMAQGDKNPAAKLTGSQVLEIRAMFDSGIGNKELATLFPVSYLTIWEITTRRTWRHI